MHQHESDYNYYKEIWYNKSKEVYKLILDSLDELSLGPYDAAIYTDHWKELIRQKTGLIVKPLDYLAAFNFDSFRDYYKHQRRKQ